MTLTTTIRGALRFDYRDAPRLLELARQAELRERQGAREFYAKAAIAADLGEPLIVHAASIDDLHEQAAVYVRYGVRPPAIETLNT